MIKNVKWFFVVLITGSLLSFSFSRESVFTEKLAVGTESPRVGTLQRSAAAQPARCRW